jgi:hypothetical protein
MRQPRVAIPGRRDRHRGAGGEGPTLLLPPEFPRPRQAPLPERHRRGAQQVAGPLGRVRRRNAGGSDGARRVVVFLRAVTSPGRPHRRRNRSCLQEPTAMGDLGADGCAPGRNAISSTSGGSSAQKGPKFLRPCCGSCRTPRWPRIRSFRRAVRGRRPCNALPRNRRPRTPVLSERRTSVVALEPIRELLDDHSGEPRRRRCRRWLACRGEAEIGPSRLIRTVPIDDLDALAVTIVALLEEPYPEPEEFRSAIAHVAADLRER